MDNLFERLITVHKIRNELEKELKIKKEEFSNETIEETEQLKKLKEEEQELRLEAFEILDKNDEKNAEVDDMIIIRQTITTRKITDAQKLLVAIFKHADKIDALGIPTSLILKTIKDSKKVIYEFNVEDKKVIMDMIDKFENVEGILLEGVEDSETNFVIIKNK